MKKRPECFSVLLMNDGAYETDLYKTRSFKSFSDFKIEVKKYISLIPPSPQTRNDINAEYN